ncbi:hypothetical protein KKC45_00345 [Patescibacteria group bacterium]|nr:hypothetical protein [Patescibacteria group bacterium]
MNKDIGIVVMIIMVGAAFYYGYHVAKKNIRPTLATWIISFVTMSLSLWTYYCSSTHYFWSNISNVTGVVNSFLIMIITYVIIKKENLNSNKKLFKPFQILSLKISGVIAIFWIFSTMIFGPEESSFISNIAVQILMTIASIVLIQRMLSDSVNSEGGKGYIAWILVLIGSGLAIIPASDLLAECYAWRSFLSKFIVIAVMLSMDFKNKRLKIAFNLK